MANITNELSNIARAVYGEEVRGSIHDAIAKINSATEEAIAGMTDYQSVVNNIITDFNTWYNAIVETFDGDIETNLAQAIVTLREDFTHLVEDHYVDKVLTDGNGEILEDGLGNPVEGRVIFCVAGDSHNLTSDLVYYDETNTIEDKINDLEARATIVVVSGTWGPLAITNAGFESLRIYPPSGCTPMAAIVTGRSGSNYDIRPSIVPFCYNNSWYLRMDHQGANGSAINITFDYLIFYLKTQ